MSSLSKRVCCAVFVTVVTSIPGQLAIDGLPLVGAQTSAEPSATPVEMEAAIKVVFDEGNILAYDSAARVYLDMLRAGTKSWTGADKSALTRQLHFVSLIAPRAGTIRAALNAVLGERADSTNALALVRWWNQQDPVPATLNNERLEEHLFRIYYAQRNYAFEEDSLGVDDRGRIFIRLGFPWRSTQIKLRSAGLRMQPFQVTIPRNEIWVYRPLHDDAHYLFVQRSRRKPFTLATSRDLIPPDLRMSRRRVQLLLTWLEEIFGQLTLEHPHYGPTYDAVTNYLALPTSDALQPYNFSQHIMEQMRIRDDYHVQSRMRTVPPSATQVYGSAHTLIPLVRTARFLQPNGATRLEIYWTLDSDGLEPRRRRVNRLTQEGHIPSETYLLAVSATERDSNFAPTEIRMRHYSVPTRMQGLLPVHAWVTQDFDSKLNLVLQWEQFWSTTDSTGQRIPSVTLGIGTLPIDSVQVLDASGHSLEMSDIRPMVLPASGNLQGAVPYVADTLSAATKLALYFEVYHLTYGNDDKTRYTLEYRIAAPGETPITASTTYEGEARVVREQLALDVSTWSKAGPITITLRVKDEVAGALASRTIPFTFRR